jgi:hypothetical protein
VLNAQAGIGVTVQLKGADANWSCLSDAQGNIQGVTLAAGQTVTQGLMPAYCRGEASGKFNQRPNDITTLPAERAGGGFTVYGQYPRNNPTNYFTCAFSADGQFQGVKYHFKQFGTELRRRTTAADHRGHER